MNLATILRALIDADAPKSALLAVVAAAEAEERESDLNRRTLDAARTRRYRARGGGKIPQELRLSVFERDRYACVYCGTAENLECDHDEPVSRGGATTFENLVTACRSCNARKKDRDRKAFVRSLSKEVHGQHGTSDQPPSPFPETKSAPTPPEKTQTHTLSPTPPIVPPAPRTAFDQFWMAWTPKVSKGQAETTFAKIIKTVPLETILAGVERAKAHDRRWADNCAPHASTWLNAKGWLDEPRGEMRSNRNWRELEAENNDNANRGAAMVIQRAREINQERENGRTDRAILDGLGLALPKADALVGGTGPVALRLSR